VDKEAQTRGLILDCRINYWLHVDAAIEQVFREQDALKRVANDHRNNRGIFAGAIVEATLVCQTQEKVRAVVQHRDALRLGFEYPDRSQRGGGVRWRDANTVNKT